MKYLEDYILGTDEYEFELPEERQKRQDQQVYRDGGFWLGGWILISVALGILEFFAKPLTYANDDCRSDNEVIPMNLTNLFGSLTTANCMTR